MCSLICAFDKLVWNVCPHTGHCRRCVVLSPPSDLFPLANNDAILDCFTRLLVDSLPVFGGRGRFIEMLVFSLVLLSDGRVPPLHWTCASLSVELQQPPSLLSDGGVFAGLKKFFIVTGGVIAFKKHFLLTGVTGSVMDTDVTWLAPTESLSWIEVTWLATDESLHWTDVTWLVVVRVLFWGVAEVPCNKTIVCQEITELLHVVSRGCDIMCYDNKYKRLNPRATQSGHTGWNLSWTTNNNNRRGNVWQSSRNFVEWVWFKVFVNPGRKER